jgi:hypothetical protein
MCSKQLFNQFGDTCALNSNPAETLVGRHVTKPWIYACKSFSTLRRKQRSY